jgi:organic radical activating enzyme
MSEIEHIKNILDITNKEISSTFCLAKWHHTTLYLQTGETHSCYHPPPHKILIEEIKNNPSALHNTSEKKMQRSLMLKGEKPVGCNYCWNIENLGPEYVSDRHIKTASIYTPERLAEIKNNSFDFNINPEYIEISFSNECNFKCGYCHPKASSRFWNEIEEFGPYKDSTEHRQDIDWFKVYKNEDENPFVEAWWKWWPTVSKTLNILRITGGEPLLHKSTWKLLDLLDKNPKPYLQIELNTNLGVKKSLIEKLVKKITKLHQENKIKSFKLYSSIDTWTSRAEYVRTGLDLKLWEENLDYFLMNSNYPITFMITFNIFSVTSFDSLLLKILEWRKKYNNDKVEQWQRIRFDTPHLKEPYIFDMNILPKSEYLPYMYKHMDFFKKNLDDNNKLKFSTIELKKFDRILNYMKGTEFSELKLLEIRRNFTNWFDEYDRRRKLNRYDYFPEMKGFFELCKKI